MKIFVALKSSVEISVAMRGFSQKVYSEVIGSATHGEPHLLYKRHPGHSHHPHMQNLLVQRYDFFFKKK
jgi:hypothetical protein